MRDLDAAHRRGHPFRRGVQPALWVDETGLAGHGCERHRTPAGNRAQLAEGYVLQVATGWPPPSILRDGHQKVDRASGESWIDIRPDVMGEQAFEAD
jgi:hypothetical protein